MNARTYSITALLVIIAGMAWAATLDADDQETRYLRYCNDVAVWAAEEARGIPPEHRTGTPDYRGNAAEMCPGMRPAD
ncbi:hypothetical protein [Vreelandella populi]|uniref:hypothetical protein n=1 Tax=Vreelandella populi TaxID=2498858 RepID=UPI000F8D4C0B|nr:hypothetical protein [Halomonas populi]RUR52735.1 hypothetical protein ELY40_11845 [Halomonas populi]